MMKILVYYKLQYEARYSSEGVFKDKPRDMYEK
jgi:hypothetical protein